MYHLDRWLMCHWFGKPNIPYKWTRLDCTVLYYMLSQISPSHNRTTGSCINAWRPPGYSLVQGGCADGISAPKLLKVFNSFLRSSLSLRKTSLPGFSFWRHYTHDGGGVGEELLFFTDSRLCRKTLVPTVTFLLFTGCGCFCCVVLLFSPGVISVAHGVQTMPMTLSWMSRVLC